MIRLAFSLTLAISGGALAAAGCGSGPYTGAPERIKKPRPKKRPDGKQAATSVEDDTRGPELSDEQCRTNFFAEPERGRRRSRDAKEMAMRADRNLIAAERQFGDRRTELVVDAMATLANALEKDPYAPEPTYKLAVAYALVGQKACALRLLERLNALDTMPDVEKEARRTIQRAARDPAFSQFDKEARTALGE